MPIPENADPVDAVRRFTRFYTSRLGVLQEGLLDSAFFPHGGARPLRTRQSRPPDREGARCAIWNSMPAI